MELCTSAGPSSSFPPSLSATHTPSLPRRPLLLTPSPPTPFSATLFTVRRHPSVFVCLFLGFYIYQLVNLLPHFPPSSSPSCSSAIHQLCISSLSSSSRNFFSHSSPSWLFPISRFSFLPSFSCHRLCPRHQSVNPLPIPLLICICY